MLPLPDYESIHIIHQLELIKRKPKTLKKLYCPVIGLNVNLYSNVVLSKHGFFKLLKPAESNDKNKRKRAAQH